MSSLAPVAPLAIVGLVVSGCAAGAPSPPPEVAPRPAAAPTAASPPPVAPPAPSAPAAPPSPSAPAAPPAPLPAPAPIAFPCPNAPPSGPGTFVDLAGGSPTKVHGVSVRLVGRSHKHLAAGPVVGALTLEWTKGTATERVDVDGIEVLGEGATLGVTWRVDQAVSGERVEVWQGARAPLDDAAAMACAETALGALGLGASRDGSSARSSEHGIVVVSFGPAPPVRIEIGRHTRRVRVHAPTR
jgi:hypothetical protein